MLLPGCHISQTYILFTVFIAAVIAFPYPEDEKTFNLKIGFDLTHGENGAPALRIRDFEDSNEFSPRAEDRDEKKDSKKNHSKQDDDRKKEDSDHTESKKAKLRASSSSSSEADNRKPAARNKASSGSDESGGRNGKAAPPADDKKSAEKSDNDSDGSGDSEPDAKRSTRGLVAGDVEPDDIYPKAHGRDDNDDRRRRKRSPEERLRNRRTAEKFIENYFEKKRKHKKVSKMPRLTSPTY